MEGMIDIEALDNRTDIVSTTHKVIGQHHHSSSKVYEKVFAPIVAICKLASFISVLKSD